MSENLRVQVESFPQLYSWFTDSIHIHSNNVTAGDPKFGLSCVLGQTQTAHDQSVMRLYCSLTFGGRWTTANATGDPLRCSRFVIHWEQRSEVVYRVRKELRQPGRGLKHQQVR